MIESAISVNSVRDIGGVKRADNMSSLTDEPEKTAENRDEYVPSEEKEPIGLYGVLSDENGTPRVSYDKAEKAPETVTGNTDKVDSEIKSLHDKERDLRQRLRSADENSADDIRRELEQISAELAQKDNDQYRRQNTVFN